MNHGTAAFLGMRGFFLIYDEAVDAQAQIGAQPAFGGIVFGEEFALEEFRKKSLGQVLRVLSGTVPTETDVLVNGLPVSREQRVESASLFGRVVAAGRIDAPPRRRSELCPHLHAAP